MSTISLYYNLKNDEIKQFKTFLSLVQLQKVESYFAQGESCGNDFIYENCSWTIKSFYGTFSDFYDNLIKVFSAHIRQLRLWDVRERKIKEEKLIAKPLELTTIIIFFKSCYNFYFKKNLVSAKTRSIQKKSTKKLLLHNFIIVVIWKFQIKV